MTRAHLLLALALLAVVCATAGAAAGPGVNGRIAFERRGFDNAAEVWTMNQDGTDLRRIGAGEGPAWSPDGRRIAFVNAAQDNGVWVMNADGSDRHALAVVASGDPSRPTAWLPDGTVVGLDWSPDGRTIAFGDGHGLYVVSAAGGTPTALAPEFFARWKSTAPLPQPAWSPDGTQLAFVAPDGAVYVVGSDGGNVRSLTGTVRAARGDSSTVDWSPDGATIVFGPAEGGGISTVPAAGGKPSLVLPDGAAEAPANPVWSPDGRRIAFDSNNTDICVVDRDGGNLGRLTYAPDDDSKGQGSNLAPSWLSLPAGSVPAGNVVPSGPSPDWDRNMAWGWACDIGISGRRLAATLRPARTAPGGKVVYRITLANAGTAAIGANRLVGFFVRVDGGARTLSAKASQGACRLGSPEGYCQLGALFPGERATVDLAVQAMSPGELVLTVGMPELLTPAGQPSEPSPPLVSRVPVSGCTIRGSERADILVGTRRTDVLCGLDGNDRIRPGGGADTVYAGPGNDVITAKDGIRDRIVCGSGKDVVAADRIDAVAKDCEVLR